MLKPNSPLLDFISENIFKKLNDKELWRLEGDTEPSINKMAKKELATRKVLKNIQEPTHCLNI
jgi:hypothetical protein